MTMGKERADLGFADELDDFNPADWAPQAKAASDLPARAETRKVAEASGFKSREAQEVQGRAGQGEPLRRRRTGRNAQFNLKARPETIEAFCAVADRQGWGLGETLEHAVALLEREYSAKGRGS
jgi:hypothetical protein